MPSGDEEDTRRRVLDAVGRIETAVDSTVAAWRREWELLPSGRIRSADAGRLVARMKPAFGHLEQGCRNFAAVRSHRDIIRRVSRGPVRNADLIRDIADRADSLLAWLEASAAEERRLLKSFEATLSAMAMQEEGRFIEHSQEAERTVNRILGDRGMLRHLRESFRNSVERYTAGDREDGISRPRP